MNIDIEEDERRIILHALARMRRELRNSLAATDMEGLDPILGLSMGMSFIDRFNAVAEKLGGNPGAEDFGAGVIGME